MLKFNWSEQSNCFYLSDKINFFFGSTKCIRIKLQSKRYCTNNKITKQYNRIKSDKIIL